MRQRLDLFLLQKTLWMLTKPTNVGNYDFHFERFFECQHPWQPPFPLTAVTRIGAVLDYPEFYEALQTEGVQLIHTPEQHRLCSELPNWYPLLEDLTPKSIWFSEIPPLSEITQRFQWPIFLKGARQTSKHSRHLANIDSSQAFAQAVEHYAQDPILHWQPIVCREYVPLRPVRGGHPDEIPNSFEFRTFWWKGEFIGAGAYWYEADPYQWTVEERHMALSMARLAAQRLAVNFLVVDMAQRADGQWIVIECNDGQESGYAGISPFTLWQNLLAVENESAGHPTFER
jgi:hypothetical protein